MKKGHHTTTTKIMDWFRNVPNVIRSQSSQSDHSANNSATTGRNSTGLSDKNFNNHDDISSLNRTATKFHSDNRRNSKDSTNNNNDQFGTTALALSRFMSATSENRRKSSVSREELTCALCGELYTDPRLLPCLHSFCKRCLEHTVNPRSTTLTCHLCRKEVALKVGNQR